jgi:small subunit ribosomal protein S2
MDKLPGVVIVIDTKREVTALREAKKLGIPTIALIDTDGDPELVDIPIPGNDDGMRSIDVIMRELCLAVSEGKQQRGAGANRADANAASSQDGTRRSRRAQYRSDDANASAGGDEAGSNIGAGEAVKQG